MKFVHGILNLLAATVTVSAAAIFVLAPARPSGLSVALVATVPLLIHVFAGRPNAPAVLRIVGMGLNWVGAVLTAALGAAALATGLRGTSELVPLLGCAAALYGWNAVVLAFAAI